MGFGTRTLTATEKDGLRNRTAICHTATAECVLGRKPLHVLTTHMGLKLEAQECRMELRDDGKGYIITDTRKYPHSFAEFTLK